MSSPPEGPLRRISAADRWTPAQRLPLCVDSYRNRSPKSRRVSLGTFRWQHMGSICEQGRAGTHRYEDHSHM